ncbi:DUF2628 domain-containing protein [Gottfriedia acidiceleris]|uniref:DUF2628 domain-containing protein n=1 Tax=Gottfriedia acidiceleris TaxID=371036 RepID=UPI00101CB4E5|nr:DUF2628 domain-containing protein [Gottfriedia acidiceleris]
MEHRLEAYEKVVKNNTSYYGLKWDLVSDPAKKNTWNWAAFFFTLFWFAYRKMYKVFLLLSFIVTLWTVTYLIIDSPLWLEVLIYWVIPLIISLLLGWHANRLYYLHISKLLKQTKSLPEKRRDYYIQNKGGTHVGIMIGLGCLLLFLDFVIVAVATYIPTSLNIVNTVAGTDEGIALEDYTDNPQWKVIEKRDRYYEVEFKGYDYSYNETVRILFNVYFYKDVYDWKKVYLNGKLLNDQEMEDYEKYIDG